MTEKIYELIPVNDNYGVIELFNQILVVELETGHVIDRIIINYV